MAALADIDYITKGNGWLFVNGIKVGYLTNEVKIGVKRTTDIYYAQLVPGGPMVPIKKVAAQEVVSISAGLAVISAHNLGRGLGQKTVTDIAASSVSVVDGTNDLRTVMRDNVSGKLFIFLGDGPGLGHTYTVTTLKKGSATLVSNPTANYEYTLDPTFGFVWLEAGGVNDIVEGDVIDCVTYGYQRSKGQRIDFGTIASIEGAIIHFIHKEPNGNVESHAVLRSGACNGDFELAFGTNDWVKEDVVWEGQADERYPTNPVGYFFQRDLAA